ncbi:MAG: efflux RND transporter periplasmic adaptor subunit [Hyphomicrobium aestuarii]|nr:efflux RND transporter periplasmic adaptor subunit [Hyphomicrobium aestuarii]
MKSNLILLAVIAAGAAGWYVLHQPGQPVSGTAGSAAEPKTAVAPAVSVVKATLSDFVETVLVTGSVVARDEVMIAPEIEGFRIVELAAEEGDTIKKGQVLARLANATLDAALAQSDANIARASAAIAVARSAIVQAEAAEKEADQAFDRARPLKQSGTISEAVFDQREAAAKTSAARLNSARESLLSAEADKAAIEASRREIVWRRERSEIRSPVDGTVSRRTARVGAVASAAGDPLFRIVANGEIELDAEISERDVGRIKDGQPATVTITGMGEARGVVRLVSSEVDRTTRIGRAKIGLGSNSAFKLGAFGRGTIETGRSRGIGLPTSAVVFGANGATVQVVKNDRVETRRVTIGLSSQQLVEIKDGIAEGDVVVVKAGSFLRDGDAVRPMTTPTTLSTAAP